MNVQYANKAYTKAMVSTSARPLDLVILLYDGGIEFLHKSIFYMSQNKLQEKLHYMGKAMAIIEYLLATLDKQAGGEVARNLERLYVYMLTELTHANLKNNIEKVSHIEGLLKELRSAWRDIR